MSRCMAAYWSLTTSFRLHIWSDRVRNLIKDYCGPVVIHEAIRMPVYKASHEYKWFILISSK